MDLLKLLLGGAIILVLWRTTARVLGPPWSATGLKRWAGAGFAGVLLLTWLRDGGLHGLELPSLPEPSGPFSDGVGGAMALIFVFFALVGRFAWDRRAESAGARPTPRLPPRRRVLPPAPVPEPRPEAAQPQRPPHHPPRTRP